MESMAGNKSLEMNTGKTKVMFSCSMKDRVEEKGKWPGGVCFQLIQVAMETGCMSEC